MAKNVGDDESDFGSVTSSQKSFLNNCSFAEPESVRQALPTKSSDGVVETESDNTEVLGNPISPPITRTPVISFSSPTSVDSINDDDVFRTPPENASLSSATADSDPRVRFPEMKPDSARRGSKLKSPPSSKTVTTTSPSPVAAGDVRVPGKNSDLDSPSPPSVAAGNVRVPGKNSDSSPTAIGKTKVLENQPISDSMGVTGPPKSPSPAISPGKQVNPGSSAAIKMTEAEDPKTDIPFKEIIESLLRNSGENLPERDEMVSYVDILKQCGLKFP